MIKQKLNTVLNIHSNEWARVGAAWILGFIIRTSFVIAWTLIMAVFISRFGVNSLVHLFIINAFGIMIGSIIYSELIKYVSTKKLIISSSLLSALCFLTNFYLLQSSHSNVVLMTIMFFAISVFLSQLIILLGSFIEELFTPLESERTFPVIESYEVLGAIVAGILITYGSTKFDISFFFAFIGVSLILASILINHFYSYKKKIPFLSLHHEKIKPRTKLTISETFSKIKTIPFAKTLAVIVLMQFAIFTFVEYQFTKGLALEVIKENEHHEVSETQEQKFSVIPEHLAVSIMGSENVEETNNSSHSNSSAGASHSVENEIAHKLGSIVLIASIITFLTQILFANKILQKLGAIRTMMIHPLVTIVNVSIFNMSYGSTTSSNLRIWFENTYGLFLNAYHSSYYSLPEEERIKIKEFIDGIMKPIGIIIATLLMYGSYSLMHGEIAFSIINTLTVLASIIMIALLMKARNRYTDICLKNLKDDSSDINTKRSSIEVLEENGHRDIFDEIIFEFKKENLHTKIKEKLIEFLGTINSEESIKLLLIHVNDVNSDIKIAAIKGISKLHKNFHNVIDNILKNQIVIKLKTKFELEEDVNIKTEIIKTLKSFGEQNLALYILEIAKKHSDPKDIAKCLETLKLINISEIADKLEDFLNSANPEIKSRTINILWEVDRLRTRLKGEIDNMFSSLDREVMLNAFYVAGEIKDHSKKNILKNFLKSNDIEVRLLSSIALAKIQDSDGIYSFVKLLTHENEDIAEKVKKELKKFSVSVKDKIDMALTLEVTEKINKLMKNHMEKEKLPKFLLQRLKAYYELMDQFEEAERIEEMLGEK